VYRLVAHTAPARGGVLARTRALVPVGSPGSRLRPNAKIASAELLGHTTQNMMQISKWPKVLPPMTPEQELISDAFMKLWHEELPRRSRLIETFNHSFPVKHSRPGFTTTLEIGAGLGEHILYEKLTAARESNYYAVEPRENMTFETPGRESPFDAHLVVVVPGSAAVPEEDEPLRNSAFLHLHVRRSAGTAHSIPGEGAAWSGSADGIFAHDRKDIGGYELRAAHF
jgi:hypothetical protein